jgi:hypothetical protein
VSGRPFVVDVAATVDGKTDTVDRRGQRSRPSPTALPRTGVVPFDDGGVLLTYAVRS